MTLAADPLAAARRRPRWRLLVIVVAVVVAVGVTMLVVGTRAACGCAIPPSEDAAIESARDFVAAVADGTTDVPDGAADALAALDDPATVWAVVHTRRPDGGYGDAPAVRVIVGLAPDETWDAVVVRSASDYQPGDVEATVRKLTDSRPEVVRGGATPLFDVAGGSSADDDSTPSVTLLATGREPESLEPLETSGTWVYTGDGLPPGRYLVVEGGENHAADPAEPYAAAAWFDVTEAG
ncbi:MAG TPA: hypothetical protein VIP77_10490 [Jiangellaceae bacterium]